MWGLNCTSDSRSIASRHLRSIMVRCTAWPCWDILTRRARIRACTRTRACMHLRVMAAWRRTVWPRTNAWSLTSPFRARNALRACKMSTTWVKCYSGLHSACLNELVCVCTSSGEFKLSQLCIPGIPETRSGCEELPSFRDLFAADLWS